MYDPKGGECVCVCGWVLCVCVCVWLGGCERHSFFSIPEGAIVGVLKLSSAYERGMGVGEWIDGCVGVWGVFVSDLTSNHRIALAHPIYPFTISRVMSMASQRRRRSSFGPPP